MIYDPEHADHITNRLNGNAQAWLSIYTRLSTIIAEMDTAFISQAQASFHATNESNRQTTST